MTSPEPPVPLPSNKVICRGDVEDDSDLKSEKGLLAQDLNTEARNLSNLLGFLLLLKSLFCNWSKGQNVVSIFQRNGVYVRLFSQ